MASPAKPALGVERRIAARPFWGTERRGASRPLSATSILLLMLVLADGAWIAGQIELYTSRSNFGYYTGVVGSIFMLTLLLYPLRKRLRILRRFGDLRGWFRVHMFLGISGPLLILYHCTLKVGSLNAAVAFYSMLIVAGSGIIGRFFYTKIHHGLYGRQATLRERQAQLGLSGESLKSNFNFAPHTEQRLKALEAYAMDETQGGFFGVGRLVGVTVRVRWVYWQSMREVKRILAQAGAHLGWTPQERASNLQLMQRMLKGYLRELQEVAQFRAYERLFSLWHVLHVPFVFLLVFSAIVHVIAVHMY